MIDGVGRGPVLQQATPRLAGGETSPRGPVAFEPANRSPGQAAAKLGGIVREMAASAPVDGARVEALRLAIAAGGYKADPDAIAARMLAFGRK